MPIRPGRPAATRTFLRCTSYLRPYWRFVAGAYLLLLVNNGVTLSMPLIIRSIVDDGIRGGDAGVIRWGVLTPIPFR